MSTGFLRQASRLGGWFILLVLVSAWGGSSLVPVVISDLGRERELPFKKPAPPSLPAYHIIRPGETLYSIAWHYGKDFKNLARWNGIEDPYRIYAGQRLYLVPSRSQRPPSVKRAGDSPSPEKPYGSPTPVNKAQIPGGQGGGKTGIQWQWPAQGVLLRSGTELGKQGLEILGREGQPVRAAAPGEVVYSGDGLRGYGKLIIIEHSPIYLSAYAHNKRLLVREGTRVSAGQQIAEMGRTGSRQVKLHFEIRHNGKPVPPLQYLPDTASN